MLEKVYFNMMNKYHKKLNKKFLNALNNKVFTGAAVAVSKLSEKEFLRDNFYWGESGKKKNAKIIDNTTFFDIASLTKPLVTILAVLSLIKEKKVDFKEKLDSLLSITTPFDKKEITLIDLLSHSSGLPAHRDYHKKLWNTPSGNKQKKLINWILNEKLVHKPGQKKLYSDLDYILLGEIIEKKSGLPIYSYWKKKIIDPLNISEKYFFIEEDPSGKDFVSTGVCCESGEELFGKVNDDNCRAVGKTCGHTGLFSTLDGVVHLTELILSLHDGSYEHVSIKRDDFLSLVVKKEEICGFDTPSGRNSSSGTYFSKKTIGHLGYTGTSFWIDLEKKIIVILLTNRVIFGDDKEKIKKFRPDFHNVVMSQL